MCTVFIDYFLVVDARLEKKHTGVKTTYITADQTTLNNKHNRLKIPHAGASIINVKFPDNGSVASHHEGGML